jgi:hypothetical protein
MSQPGGYDDSIPVKRYRIATNPYNTSSPPWRGATGIEEVEYWGSSEFTFCNEVLAVPSLVCWFNRGTEELAHEIVALLNEKQK